MVEKFCLSCKKQICKECTKNIHGQHHTEDMDIVRNSLDTAFRDAAKEIAERMQTKETDIVRIRVARESEANDKRKLRREVVTYYEGYENNVYKHKANLERKISMQQENTSNILLGEEVQLEQYRLNLQSLCAQIQKLISLKNFMEVVNLMVPVAKKLETISGEIMATGEAIINKLQFLPKSLSHGDIPGFLSTFSVCQAKSYAMIDRTICEKVLCSISLYLVDDNGLKLDVYREIDIQAVMTLYHKQDKNCQTVNVSVENNDSAGSGGWSLVFNPPFPGIAHLSVTVDGAHIKNSPYVIMVKTLSLDDTVHEISKFKKGVKFNQIDL